MRPAQLASLLALLLMVSAIQAGPRKGSEEVGPPILRRPRPEPVVLATWQTEGGGETREEAEEDALKKAGVLVMQYFAEQHAPMSWTLDLQYVRTRLMKSSEEAEPKKLPDGLGLWRKVKVQVVLNSDDRDDILRQDREFRMHDREFFLGKILLVLVALLTAVAGYFRLDEATKGYYTGWLRLGAAGLVGAAAMGLWWMSS
jgi:hypothetical protein